MENFNESARTYFYVIGLSYKKADARLRGEFSLDQAAKTNLLLQAKSSGVQSIVATSTCNLAA
jgi:glutamyl-tRNA reductase